MHDVRYSGAVAASAATNDEMESGGRAAVSGTGVPPAGGTVVTQRAPGLVCAERS
jgi:hypothetical protein